MLMVLAGLVCSTPRAAEVDYSFIKQAWEMSMRVKEFLRLQAEVGKICGAPVTSAFTKWKAENAADLTHFDRMRLGMEKAIAKSAPSGQSPEDVFKSYDAIIEDSVTRGVAPFSGMNETQRLATCQRWAELLTQSESPIRKRIHDQLAYFIEHQREIKKNFDAGA